MKKHKIEELILTTSEVIYLFKSLKSALAALSQNKTFPADVEYAKRILQSTIHNIENNNSSRRVQ